MINYSVQDIIPLITEHYTIIGNQNGKFFNNVKSPLKALSNSLVFISAPYKLLMRKTKAQIIICDHSIEITDEDLHNKCFIIVKNPKLEFVKISKFLFRKSKTKFTIHPSSIIDSQAKIHNNVCIRPFSSIGKVDIDEGTIIYENCYIGDNVKIGKNVKIYPGCIIGKVGFGHLINENGAYENFPHFGSVIIEDEVEIGANTTIDSGALEDTIIKKGTKIDNLVHVAHNVEIGGNSLITAGVIIGGSVKIGHNAWLGINCSIKDGITLGNNVTIGMGSVVIRNVPDNSDLFGIPAIPKEKFVKMNHQLRELIKKGFKIK